MLAYVLLFSLFLSLVATGVQLIGEFERRKNDLLNDQTRAAELVSGSMSNNIWLMNFSEVANSLDDMKAVPAVQYGRVVTQIRRQRNGWRWFFCRKRRRRSVSFHRKTIRNCAR